MKRNTQKIRMGTVLFACALLVLSEPLAAYAGAEQRLTEAVEAAESAAETESVELTEEAEDLEAEETEKNEEAGETESGETEEPTETEGTETPEEPDTTEIETTEKPGETEAPTEMPEEPDTTETETPEDPGETEEPTEMPEETEATEKEPTETEEEPMETEEETKKESTETEEETEKEPTEIEEETEEAQEDSARAPRNPGKKIAGKAELKGAAQTRIAVDETNFPDENFRSYVLRFDLDNDGFLSAAELSKVTEINVNARKWSDSQKIKSLEGVEFFGFLRKLDCAYNRLSMLDVRECSRLETLVCGGNGLRKIAVSDLAFLQVLETADNALTSLDLGGCTALVSVDVKIGRAHV